MTFSWKCLKAGRLAGSIDLDYDAPLVSEHRAWMCIVGVYVQRNDMEVFYGH